VGETTELSIHVYDDGMPVTNPLRWPLKKRGISAPPEGASREEVVTEFTGRNGSEHLLKAIRRKTRRRAQKVGATWLGGGHY